MLIFTAREQRFANHLIWQQWLSDVREYTRIWIDISNVFLFQATCFWIAIKLSDTCNPFVAPFLNNKMWGVILDNKMCIIFTLKWIWHCLTGSNFSWIITEVSTCSSQVVELFLFQKMIQFHPNLNCHQKVNRILKDNIIECHTYQTIM